MNEQPSLMRAAIAIGSQTIRLVVARSAPSDLDIVASREALVHIGESVTATGAISGEMANVAIAVLKRYKALAKRQKADLILVVATEVLRQASNRAAFLEQVQRATNLAVHLISATAAAALTCFGATHEGQKQPGQPAYIGVMHPREGSLELVTARHRRITWRTSLPIGSGWLHDRFLSSDPPGYNDGAIAGAFLHTYFQGLHWKHRPSVLIVTGGSATSLLQLVHHAFQLEEHQTHLTQHDLLRCQGLLSALTAQELAERYDLEVGRARVLLAEALLMQTVMSCLRSKAIHISSHGMPEGVLLAYERYGARWLESVRSAASLDQAQPAGVAGALAPEQEPFSQSGRRKLKQRARTLLALPAEVLKDEDVEAVHNMRVASRRLRATLDAYQSLCDPHIFTRAYRRVRQAADVLGAARDTDVMFLNLEAQLEQVQSEEKDGVAWMMERLHTFRQQQQHALETFLQTFDADTLKKQIALLIPEGGTSHGQSQAHDRA